MASRNWFCRQYLQNFNDLIFWFNHLQKVNAMPSDFWWKKKKVLPLWQITFDPLKNGLKIFISKTCIFFIRNLRAKHLFFAGTNVRIWGHLFSAGIALQLYSTLRFEWLKWIQKLRAIPWEFWDEVFSL